MARWQNETSEITRKHAPGTKIISRKGDLYGKTLGGRMILEVPVQEALVPAGIIRECEQGQRSQDGS